MVHRCLNGRAPRYLATLCVPVASVASRQRLRSAARRQLAVQSYDDVECTTDTVRSSGCHYCCFWTISEDCYVLGVLTY